jgi:hypothetical protein
VESDSTVVVPVMNKGHQPVTLAVEKALVALDEAQYISNPVAMQEYDVQDEEEMDEVSEEETRELPFYFLDLYQSAIQDRRRTPDQAID